MTEDSASIEQVVNIRWYIGVLWRWVWLIILVAILSGTATFIVNSATIPIFQSSTTIMINDAPGAKGTDYNSLLTSTRLATTYSQILTTRPMLEKVIQQLGLSMGTGALKRKIVVKPARDTQLITVQVRDPDPARAAQIANTLVDVFAAETQRMQASRYVDSKENLSSEIALLDKQVQETEATMAALGDSAEDRAKRDRLTASLAQYRQSSANLLQSYEEVRLAEAQSSSNVVIIDPAQPAISPILPRIRFNTLLATLFGAIVALGLVLLKEGLDDTVKDPEQLSHYTGVPILGVIADFGTDGNGPIVNTQPRSPVAEAFRTLRTNIGFASVDRPLNTLMVTSASPDEGKSTIISNLGGVLAQSGRRVVLVEGDLRRPTLHKKLGLRNKFGMSTLFVQSRIVLDEVLQETNIDRLSVLTSGELPPNPAELLGSAKMGEILEHASKHAELVLIDTPPVLAVTDAIVMASRVDGVLLVVKAGTTKIGACKQSLEQLRFAGANVVGIVVNSVQLRGSRYGYAYHGYYSYSYTSEDIKGTEDGKRWRWPRRRSKQVDRSTGAVERVAEKAN